MIGRAWREKKSRSCCCVISTKGWRNREYIVIINNSRIDPKVYYERFQDFPEISFLVLDERYTLGDCLNYGVDMARYDFVGKMDDGVHFVYFEANCALGIRLPITVPYSPEEGAVYENRFTHGPSLAGGTFIIKREVFSKVKFQSLNLGEDVKFMQECTKKNILIYGADRYNYVYMRHDNRLDHTWNVDSHYVYKQAHIIDRSRNFLPIITV